jgi:hypothetical protein
VLATVTAFTGHMLELGVLDISVSRAAPPLIVPIALGAMWAVAVAATTISHALRRRRRELAALGPEPAALGPEPA